MLRVCDLCLNSSGAIQHICAALERRTSPLSAEETDCLPTIQVRDVPLASVRAMSPEMLGQVLLVAQCRLSHAVHRTATVPGDGVQVVAHIYLALLCMRSASLATVSRSLLQSNAPLIPTLLYSEHAATAADLDKLRALGLDLLACVLARQSGYVLHRPVPGLLNAVCVPACTCPDRCA